MMKIYNAFQQKFQMILLSWFLSFLWHLNLLRQRITQLELENIKHFLQMLN